MRTDLKNKKGEKVRTGKLIAQGAHASMKAVLDIFKEEPNETSQQSEGNVRLELSLDADTSLHHWLMDKFTKVCVKIDSEEALLALYEKAKASGLPCALILDAGLTEFDKPTYTCMSVGPGWSDEVDAVTGGLSLL